MDRAGYEQKDFLGGEGNFRKFILQRLGGEEKKYYMVLR